MLVRQRSRFGFSLIESVVMVGLISLIVVFTLGMVPSFKMSNRRANMELKAGALAQSTLEQLRSAPFASLVPGPLLPVLPPDDGISYARRVEVRDVVTAGTPPQQIAHTVRVVVTWGWRDRTYSTFRETVLCRLLGS